MKSQSFIIASLLTLPGLVSGSTNKATSCYVGRRYQSGCPEDHGSSVPIHEAACSTKVCGYYKAVYYASSRSYCYYEEGFCSPSAGMSDCIVSASNRIPKSSDASLKERRCCNNATNCNTELAPENGYYCESCVAGVAAIATTLTTVLIVCACIGGLGLIGGIVGCVCCCMSGSSIDCTDCANRPRRRRKVKVNRVQPNVQQQPGMVQTRVVQPQFVQQQVVQPQYVQQQPQYVQQQPQYVQQQPQYVQQQVVQPQVVQPQVVQPQVVQPQVNQPTPVYAQPGAVVYAQPTSAAYPAAPAPVAVVKNPGY